MPKTPPFRGFRGFNTPNNTQVPDELFDELMVHLSGAELKVLLYIIRRTFGFKRETDNISLSQMLNGIVKRDGTRLDHGTGLSKPTLLNALRSLTQNGLVVSQRRRTTARGDEATTYCLRLLSDAQLDPSGTSGSSESSEEYGNAPVVKKFDQGEEKKLTGALVKKIDQAVVKKSAPQVTVTKEQVNEVVNDVTPNDPKTSIPPTRRTPPTISTRALRTTYGLTDDQIGRVHYLVEKQIDILGAADRNHANYVKRAAEAVRDGQDALLDHTLGDFKQAAGSIAIGTKPAYFHAMYAEALANRQAASSAADMPPRQLAEAFSHLFEGRSSSSDPDGRISRMIADAEKRGVLVPDHIRTSTDPLHVGRWWATTVPDQSGRRGT